MGNNAARKRINRMMRMSGRSCRNQNNLGQLVDSKRWQADVAAGGMEELKQLSDTIVAQQKTEEERAEEFRRQLLGYFA